LSTKYFLPQLCRRTEFIVQTFRGFGLTALFEDTGKAAGHFDVKKVSRII